MDREVFNKSNTIYKITSDLSIGDGESFYLPDGVVLDFQGGTISGGTLVLDNTTILPNGCVLSKYISSQISGKFATGQCVYDPALNKPKWWTGSKWVDATGAEA